MAEGNAPLRTLPRHDAAALRHAATIADPAAATRAYLDAVPAERRAATKAYANGDYALDVAGSLLNAAILLAFVVTGASARLRDGLARTTRRRWLQASLFWSVLAASIALLGFPLRLHRSYVREKAFGLMTQPLGGWVVDQIKLLLLACLLGSILVAALYAVIRRSPRRWWLWAAAAVAGFQMLTNAILPVLLAPLFYRFTPLRPGFVRNAVLEVAERSGVAASNVYEIDASRRTDRISAAVLGLFGTTRIVFFDTTLERCSLAEIRFITGHEAGHFVKDDLWTIEAVRAPVTLAGFALAAWAFRFARRPSRLGLTGPADLAGLPLIWLMLGTAVFVLSPARYAVLRSLELRADTFGFDASGEPDAAATTFLKLGEYRDLEPEPLVEAFFFSHPAGRTRIRNAMDWRARQRGGS